MYALTFASSYKNHNKLLLGNFAIYDNCWHMHKSFDLISCNIFMLNRSVFPTGVGCVQFQVCASLGGLDSEHSNESNTTSNLSSCVIMFLTSNHEVRIFPL